MIKLRSRSPAFFIEFRTEVIFSSQLKKTRLERNWLLATNSNFQIPYLYNLMKFKILISECKHIGIRKVDFMVSNQFLEKNYVNIKNCEFL